MYGKHESHKDLSLIILASDNILKQANGLIIKKTKKYAFMNQRLHHPRIIALLLLALITMLNACSINKIIPLHPKTTKIAGTALLVVPVEVDLIYHNGQNIELLPAYQKKITYSLLAGEHWLGFQYQDIHYDDDENQEIITSKKAFIHYTAIAGNTYQITFDAPKNYSEAKLLENSLQLRLSLNDTLIAKSSPVRPIVTQITPNALPETTPKTITPLPTVDHLKHWWKKATVEERQTFIHWIDNKPNTKSSAN